MMEIAQKLLTCLCICLLVLVSVALAVDLTQDDDAGISNGYNDETCSHTITNMTGLFEIHANELSGYKYCVWTITVDNASSLHLLLTSDVEGSQKDSNNNVTVLVSGRGPAGSGVVSDSLHGVDDYILRTFQGSTIYLNFTLDPSHSASNVEDIQWSVAYIASTQGNFQTCDNSSIEVPAHGRIIVESNTFGSVASLECSEGYTLAGSSQYAVCTVQNGLLSWISRGAECESVCRHPPQVLHASIHLSVDTAVRFIRPDTKDEGMSSVMGSRVSSRVTNSTVEYTCQLPYLLSGRASIRCSPDTQGVPQWSDSPPSCYIPDCSSRISLRQHSGAMVNPLNPHSEEATLQDSVTCVWEISGPSDAVVSFHVKSFDFPQTSGAEIVFTDSGASRPRELLRISEQGQLQNVTSDTSKVLVTYNGPYAGINEDGCGLYVEYIMRSRDSIRQAVTPDDSTTTVSDDAATSLPPTQNAPSSPVPLLSSSTNAQQTTTTAAPVTAAPTTAAPTTPTPSTMAGPVTISSEATVSDTTDTVPTMSTTEQPVRSPLPFLSSSAGVTPSVVYISTSPVDTASGTSPFVAASDESSDDWKIAVGFVVPIVILISVLVGVYICYRKKYPVRMIIGREFGKFSNPQYSRPQRMSTLVRNDAEDYFSNRNSMNVSSEEFNPVNDRILYDNPAFVKDDAEDEEEAERKFRERKSWLFKSSSEEPDSEPKRATDVHAGQSEERKTSTSETDADHDQTDAARKESVLTIDSDISEILSEQKQTPKPKRRNKKEKRTSSSASVSISSHENGADEKSTASELSTDANKEDAIKDEQALAQNGDVTDGNPVITIDKVPDENSSTCMRTAKLLFEQPTFEEAWAEVKARARSMSVDRPNLPSVKPRSSSLIETSKSARRMSLHDEVLLSAHVKRLNALDKMAPLQRSQELPNIYASVVAADVRARQRSFASSVMTDEEDVLENLPLEERERCMSMTSLNSNPHLVTDLDESLSHNDSNDEGDGVTGKWSVGQASDVDDDYEDAKAEPTLPKSSNKTVPSGNASKTDSERENTTEKDKTSKKKARQSKSARAKKSSTKIRSDLKSSSQSNQSSEGSEVIQRATVAPLTEASSETVPGNKDSEENDTDQQSDDGFLQRSVINPTSSYVSAVQIVLKSKDDSVETAAGIADTSMGEDKAEQVNVVDEAKAERTMSQSSQSHSDSNSDKLSWHRDDEKDSGPSPAPFESKTQLNLATGGVAEETSDLHTDAGQNKIKIMHLRDLKAQSDSDAGDDSEGKEDDDSGDVDRKTRKDNETEEEDDEDFTASGPRKIKFVLPPREHTVSQCSDESVKGSSDDASETDSSEDGMGMTSYDFNAGQDDEQQHEDNSDQSHSDTDSHDKNEEFSALSPKDTHLSSPSASASASLSASESLNISQAPAAELLTLSETKNKDKYRASSGDHQQIKLIPDVRYSDTSSESSDKEESGEILVLSARARQDSDETAGDKHAPRRINIGNIDISDDDNDEDDQDNQHKLTDSDLSEILEESNEEEDVDGKDKQGAISFDFGAPKTYVFRDENSDDEDIDV